jgi:formate dehydrogenase subunit delta
MSAERLVIMANDIAAFFHGSSDAGEAASSVAKHLRLYWDPRMRKQIMEHLSKDGAGLSELARAGVQLLAQESTPSL